MSLILTVSYEFVSLMNNIIEFDVVIIGGGIAGLWLFRSLNNLGYQTVLLDRGDLGGGQTIKSQGIVHGGIKYTLSGRLTKSSQTIAAMPDRWRKALKGQGEIVDPDLRQAKILSPHHYLWAQGGVGAKISTFLASKILNGRLQELNREHFPKIFNHPIFDGRVYQLNEVVLDIRSVVHSLVSGLEEKTLLLPRLGKGSSRFIKSTNGFIQGIEINNDSNNFFLQAKRYVLSAGEGIAELLTEMEISKPQMQIRPLHMVLIKHQYSHPIYAHCLGASSVPRVTITSHPTDDGNCIWYLGGSIAEEGVSLSAEQLISHARNEIHSLLPWVDLNDAKWATLRVNRAEPKQSQLLRPDGAFCQNVNNAIIVWPTKLALAPDLCDKVINLLDQAKLAPGLAASSLPKDIIRPSISSNFWNDVVFHSD